MEIIHLVLGKANPNRMNGINKVVHELAKQQASSGRNVSVWGISETGKNVKQDLPFEAKIFQGYKNLFRLDKDLVAAIKAKKGQAIFHLHGSWVPTFYSISRVLRKEKIPYITMQHGGYNKIAIQKSKFIKSIYFSLFEKHLIRGAAFVQCIGDSEVDGLKELKFEDKAFLQPYGFNLSNLDIPVVKNDALTFCYMGRIDAHTKGLDLIIVAFEKHLQTNPFAQLWFIGEGKDREALEKTIIEKKLMKNITFWGALFEQEKNEMMAISDVFLHPSRNEGLPSAIFEAANLGLPIIASMATNIWSFVIKRDAGWVIENENSCQLANAMEKAKSGELRRRKGENAKKMVQKDFNWRNTLINFDQMYKLAFEK